MRPRHRQPRERQDDQEEDREGGGGEEQARGRVRPARAAKPALEALLEGADEADALRKSPLGYRLDTCYLLDKLPLFDPSSSETLDW